MAWLVERKVATVVVGDPKGITTRDCGRHQNLRLHNWRRTHLLACLSDKAEVAGIRMVQVDERGTSSTCPECHRAAPKPKGRPGRRVHACDRTRHAPSGWETPSTA